MHSPVVRIPSSASETRTTTTRPHPAASSSSWERGTHDRAFHLWSGMTSSTRPWILETRAFLPPSDGRCSSQTSLLDPELSASERPIDSDRTRSVVTGLFQLPKGVAVFCMVDVENRRRSMSWAGRPRGHWRFNSPLFPPTSGPRPLSFSWTTELLEWFLARRGFQEGLELLQSPLGAGCGGKRGAEDSSWLTGRDLELGPRASECVVVAPKSWNGGVFPVAMVMNNERARK